MSTSLKILNLYWLDEPTPNKMVVRLWEMNKDQTLGTVSRHLDTEATKWNVATSKLTPYVSVKQELETSKKK